MASPKPDRVFLWTTPRAISTAFFRAIMNLDDAKMFYEPYTLPYYFGCDRKGALYLDHPIANYDSITDLLTFENVDKMLQKAYSDKRLVFVKDLPYLVADRLDNFLKPEFSGYKHSFLIRNPKKAVVSHYKVLTNVANSGGTDEFDPGLSSVEPLYRLYHQLKAQGVGPLPIVDADDLLAEPEKTLKAYCTEMGMQYKEGMSRWEAGPLPFSQFYPGWFKDVEESTGLVKKESQAKTDSHQHQQVEGVPIVRQTIDANMRFYEELTAEKMKIE